MKKLFVLCVSLMMLAGGTTALAGEKQKSTNIMVGVTPALGRYTASFKLNYENAPKDKFTYNKELGVTVGLEHVINGIINMPELHWYRGTVSEASIESQAYDMPYRLPYATINDVSDYNEIGFMEWLGFTINSKKRFQIPLMAGIGASYVNGAPLHNIFFDYGVKVRMKFYFTPKFGMFLGGFYGGGTGSSQRNMPSGEKDDKYKLKKTNLGAEVGLTFTL